MKKIAFVVSGLLIACAPAAWAAGDVIASAGQTSVTQADLTSLLKSISTPNRERLAADPSRLDQLVRANLAEKALLAEAKSKGWDKQPQVQTMVEEAQRRAVVQSYVASVSAPPADYPSEQEIQSAYDKNPAAFTTPRMFDIAQIYIAIPATDDASVEKARKQAADITKRAQAHGADFAALARANSQDPQAATNGGDAGFLPERALLADVRQAVDPLKPGDVTGPIQTQDGFHVLKLVGTRPASLRPLADVKEQIRAALREQRAQENAQAYMQKLAGTAPINEDALKKALAAAQ